MRPLFILFLSLFSSFIFAQSFDNGFPFHLPADDSTTQRFLPEFSKVAADDYVTVGADGYFMADGEPIRFWGMNLAYSACFPEKDDAEMIAARLRKMGVNLVRFALMDSPWGGEDGNIFFGESTTQVIDFFTLDRLHYFVAQLKEEGIYSNFIIHHSRTFLEGDGVVHADSINQTAKAVNMFDRQMIDLQKDFALQLLAPVNTYTGLSMADDPAVALIEISDENTLYGYWKSDWLEHQSNGGGLIQRHIDSLDQRWNEFLQNKYDSQNELETAWNATAGTGGQNEQVLDGDFEMGDMDVNYVMELHDVAEATMTADTNNPFDGDFSGRVDVTNATNTNWHIQFKQSGASLTYLKTYQISFAARSDADREIQLVASRENAPYNWYGGMDVALTTDWQEFTFTFTANEENINNFRLGYQFNGQEGSYWFDNLSMTDADVSGVLPGESLAAGNIARMLYSERSEYSPHRMADNTEFYLTVQSAYFDGMYAYLKNELGVNANITASNAWSGISDLYTARNMDYIDDHNIWDYVRYPNGWSQSDWYIENIPMVKEGWSTMQNMFSGLAIKDKPYTISEYSHPFPNRYQTEMMPWMAAYGSFHNAAALTFYYYNDDGDSWTTDQVDDYFSLHRNTAQMALSPAYAFAFRHQLIATAETTYEMEYSLPFLRALPLSDGGGRWSKFIPYSSRLAYSHGLRTIGFDGTGAPDLDQLPSSQGTVATTDTDETTIDFEQGILKTATPSFVSVCGFMNENEVEAGALKVTSANDFGVVSWLSLSGEPLANATNSLITISSKLQNTNMAWSGINSINDNWGSSPTEMFPLQLTLEMELDADYLQLYPLSEIGEEGSPIIVPPVSTGKFIVNIDQMATPTTWFGVEKMTGPLSDEEAGTTGIEVFPNPSSDHVFVKWADTHSFEQINLLTGNGQVVGLWNVEGQLSQMLEVGALASGVYFLKMKSEVGVEVRKLVVG